MGRGRLDTSGRWAVTSPAIRRRLERLADRSGVIRVLAIDHRDSLRAVLEPDDPDLVTDDDLRTIKIDLARAADGRATGVMLDPAVGMDPPVVAAVPAELSIIAALEAQGYLTEDSIRNTTLLEGWDATIAAARGADAVKLLALWAGSPSPEQSQVIGAAVTDADTAGLPLVLEPLPRGLPTSGPWVLDWASAHAGSGAHLFKLPYPGSADACRELTEMLPGPWVLLSAGTAFEAFTQQLTTALDAGAAGYIVGRAVWREAAVRNPAVRRQAISELVGPRLEALMAMGPI